MILTPFARHFGLQGPLVVAPLGGGPSTPELVAASSNAGALGSLAGAYLNPNRLRSDIQKTRALTQRPFAVNLFAPSPQPTLTPHQIMQAIEATKEIRKELHLPTPSLHPPFHENFEAQFSVILSEAPAAFSFVFGLIEKQKIEECHHRRIYTIGAATTLEEGLALQDLGVKAVVAQGVEAGGHRAIFKPEKDDPGIDTFSLTELLATHLKIPVIASGGMMNGQGIKKALKSGAQATQLGTAFLLCPESGTSKAYRKALKENRPDSTCLTRAFSGRLARGIENRFIRELRNQSSIILPFPAQNAFTRDIRNQSSVLENPDFLSLWAGTGVNLIREESASDLIQKLFSELE